MSDYLSHTLEYFRARIEGLESQLSQAQAREEEAFRAGYREGYLIGDYALEMDSIDTAWAEYLAQRDAGKEVR